MTKKLTTLTDQETELDLSNPDVAAMIVANDVTNIEVPKVAASSHKTTTPVAQKASKLTPFTMNLTTEQVASLIRQAGASGISWKDYLKAQIYENILTGKVGKAVISQPSTMSQRISGFKGGIVKRG